MNTITYLGYYDTEETPGADRRDYVRAAAGKMDYVAKVLKRSGFIVNIVSAARSAKKLPLKVYDRLDGGTLTLLPTYHKSGIAGKLVNKRQISTGLMRALSTLSSSDVVLCYHSLGYARAIADARKKYGFKLILEVEELYSDIQMTRKSRELEMISLNAADAYLCSSDSLRLILKQTKKPIVVGSGVYESKPAISGKNDDGKTHIVYAGNIDPLKGGAYAAVRAAAKLDDSFRMHILGPAEQDRLMRLQDMIGKANEATLGCITTYDGFLDGDEFDSFLQSCHIGLNPQNQEGLFNRSSFPSKVFVYLSNGLPVVSTDLPVFQSERLRALLTLSKTNDPDDIAEAIRNVELFENNDVRQMLSELDTQFQEELLELIGTLSRGCVTKKPKSIVEFS